MNQGITFTCRFSVISLLMLVCPLLWAEVKTGKLGEEVSYQWNTETREVVISGTGPMWDFDVYNHSPFYFTFIRSVCIDEGVTSIGDLTFEGCEILNSVVIPSSVISIGRSAFNECPKLAQIEIPSSVERIGNGAFMGCSSLTSINIPSGVTYFGKVVFGSCDALTSIVVDEDNPLFDSRNGCNAIIRTSDNELIGACKASVIPTSVTSIGDHAFYRCSSLTSIVIPSSVTTIGMHSFDGCSSLVSIEIPSSVVSIGSGAFQACESLCEVEIPEGIQEISIALFNNCTSLTSVSLPSNIVSIGELAFNNCSSLTSIIIPSAVSSLGPFAFSQCSSLTSITIPSAVRSLGHCAFSQCPSLVSMYVGETVAQCLGDYSPFGGITDTCTLYVPMGCRMRYQKALYWSDFSNICEYLPDGYENPNDYDINQDGKVNQADLIELVNFVLSFPGQEQ